MCEFDTAQTYSIALELDTVSRMEFVELTYSLSSDVAMVSPFVDDLMHTINILRAMDGTEVDIEVALREALLTPQSEPSWFRIGATSMKSLLLQLSENHGGFCRDRVETESTKHQRLSAVAVGEQAEVADLDEARGQDVEQEAADELDRIEGHDLDAVIVFGVPPAKAHLAVN